MSRRNKRVRDVRWRPARQTVPLWNAPELLPAVVAETMQAGNRAERRRRSQQLAREARHDRKYLRREPFAEAQIPAGSLLSEQTLADIRAGRYDLARDTSPLPLLVDRAQARRKRRQERASRRRNRPR